jgi:hypothetical protein
VTGPGDGPDPLPGLVGFTAVLRHAGLAVTTDRVAAYLAALDELDLGGRERAYWAGRLTLCSDPDDIARYDLAFEAWFEPDAGGGPPVPARRRPPPSRLASLTPPSAPDGADDGDDAPTLRVSASCPPPSGSTCGRCWRCCGSAPRPGSPGGAGRPAAAAPTPAAPCGPRCAPTASCGSCAGPGPAGAPARWCC